MSAKSFITKDNTVRPLDASPQPALSSDIVDVKPESPFTESRRLQNIGSIFKAKSARFERKNHDAKHDERRKHEKEPHQKNQQKREK